MVKIKRKVKEIHFQQQTIIIKSYEFHLLSNMSLTKYGCLEQDQSRKEHIFHVNVGHFPFSVYITHNTVNNNMIMWNRTFHSPVKKKNQQWNIIIIILTIIVMVCHPIEPLNIFKLICRDEKLSDNSKVK